MTLNATLITKDYIIQASDRRLTAVPSGRLYDDDANKGLVIRADDGIFAITFTGIATCRGERVDLWLAKKMLNAGAPELPMSQGVGLVAQVSTELFRTFPSTLDRRHIFVVSGWRNIGNRLEPVLWTVSNCTADDGHELLSDAKEVFEARQHMVSTSPATLFCTGIHKAITRTHRRRMQAYLRRGVDSDSAENAVVHLIRDAASNPVSLGLIGKNALAMTLYPNGVARAAHHVVSARRARYIPLLLWYESGRDFLAGDGHMDASGDGVFQFGNSLFIEPPNATGNPNFDGKFMLCLGEAKHKQEPVGDVPLFQFRQRPPSSS